jgi:eukaryotic translation initiation factor 2C
MFSFNSKIQLLNAGRIKRLCETELGVITQCCLPVKLQKGGKQYLENLSLKINVKV